MWLSKEQRLRAELVAVNVAFVVSTGVPPREAKRLAASMVQEAEKRSRAAGTFDWPVNTGDILLSDANEKKVMGTMVRDLREEGVSDNDIRWWWNQRDIERWVYVIQDVLVRDAVFLSEKDRLGSAKAATDFLRKGFVMYGHEKQANLSIEDQPLPNELHERVNKYFIKEGGPSGNIMTRASAFSSMNAFVRAEMRTGRL